MTHNGGAPAPDTPWVHRLLAGGAALLLFYLLLAGMEELLNPFLIFLALTGVLLAFRGTPVFLPLLGTAGALTSLWLLREMGFLLAPFILAAAFAYIVNPLVRRVERARFLARFRGAPDAPGPARTLAIGLISLPALGGIVAAITWGVPFLIQELNHLLGRAPEILERGAGLLHAMEERLARVRFPGVDGSEWVERLRGLDGDEVAALLRERGAGAGEWVLQGLLGIGRGVGTLLSVLGYLVLAPVVAFYLLRDWERLLAGAGSLIPRGKDAWRETIAEYDRLLAAYLRGQVLVSLSVGALTALGLWIVQFPYALLLGAIVAVFNVVPYLGLVMSLLPAVAIALTTGPVGLSLLKVAGVYTVAQSIESGVISPRIVGDSTGLHPVWVLFAILAGGFFFGFVGLLIAVPLAVGVKLLLRGLIERYRGSHLYRGVEERS